ncbi:hypothetical protein PENSPDRAFT_332874 [Peniophora sp. CONT]|nr:hypothetical protein PENSPDRAFT_332874 [Peniophora sp. CONT]
MGMSRYGCWAADIMGWSGDGMVQIRSRTSRASSYNSKCITRALLYLCDFPAHVPSSGPPRIGLYYCRMQGCVSEVVAIGGRIDVFWWEGVRVCEEMGWVGLLYLDGLWLYVRRIVVGVIFGGELVGWEWIDVLRAFQPFPLILVQILGLSSLTKLV